MTEISAPWNGVVTGDATSAPYDAPNEWARIWRDILRASKADSGPLLGSGVSPDPGLTVSATSPASATVNVSAGSALVRGTWYASDATVNLAVTANGSGSARIDTVILKKDYVAQTVRLLVKAGTPAGSPVPPTLNQVDSSLWEIPLADIAVANGFATITDADITPRRNWANLADGVYLHDVLNNSGGALETGDVVVWDFTANRAVKTTTVMGDPNVAGVWVGRTGAGGYGRVQTRGIGYVKVAGLTLIGKILVPYFVAKNAIDTDTIGNGSRRSAIGVSIKATAGAGLCLASINVNGWHEGAIATDKKSTSATSTQTTFQDVDATYIISVVPFGTRVRVTFQFGGYIQDNTKVGYWDIYSSSLAARAGDASVGLASLTGTSAVGPVHLTAIFTGLTPGITQTFKLQAKTSDISSYVAVAHPVMYAEEV